MHLVRGLFAVVGSDAYRIVSQGPQDYPDNSVEVALEGRFLLPELRSPMNSFNASHRHIDDLIQLVDEKDDICPTGIEATLLFATGHMG